MYCILTHSCYRQQKYDWKLNMSTRKGILLAGGTGSRLHPITLGVSKQLLPVYDKPMIYYPLSVLMMSNIREIAIITTPEDQNQFKRLLGDGSQWGISLNYIIQAKPDGLAQAYTLSEEFLNEAPSAMVLGDNIFFGHGLPDNLARADEKVGGGTVFGYRVADPERYGVVDFDSNGQVRQIIEKPANPPSHYAVTGLYFLDGSASERAHAIKPSDRGELEITSLLQTYLDDGLLEVELIGRGYAWLDTGTLGSLLDAGNFVRTLSERQGQQVGCPEEISWRKGWITDESMKASADALGKSGYGTYLSRLLEEG
jgi:glucose-1-phosphate thymidylyltransferase